MPTFRQLTFLALGATASLSLLACSDDGEGGSGSGGSTSSVATTATGAGGGASTSTGTGGDGTGGGAVEAKGYGYYFSQDTANNGWIITVVDPTQDNPVIATISVDELAALTGPSGNDAGPSWGDTIASPDGSRVFANASSADRMIVIETDTPSLETVLTVGGRPLHAYNPNGNGEIWTHNDNDGSFNVIDIATLTVSAPVVVGLKNTGHGKLNYGKELGTQYFATNTNDPGAWEINGETHAASFLALCQVPCADDPATPEDESLEMCGGTHDKTYDPATNTAIFQCSGAAGGNLAFVDGTTKAVLQNLVPISVGAFAYTHDKEYNLAYDNGADMVNIWDAKAPGHTLDAFDTSVTVTGDASGRGTDFRENEKGEWEAWIPTTSGTKLVSVNLETMERKDIELGVLTAPAGASHFERRGAIGGKWFFTYADSGLLMVNMDTEEIVTAPLPAGDMGRVTGIAK